MTMIKIFTGINSLTGKPTFQFMHPFFTIRRHVRNYHKGVVGRQTVFVAKRTGRGYPCRDFTSDLCRDPEPLTRQIRRYRERRSQYRAKG